MVCHYELDPDYNIEDEEFSTRARKISFLVLDVDGVLTDGHILMDAEGREIKSFHVADGLGIRLWQRTGMDVAIISGRRSHAVEHRCRELGITQVHQGIEDKSAVFDEILQGLNLQASQVAAVGDDLPDLPILARCGLAFTPRNSFIETADEVDVVTGRAGGEGAVREAIELILKVRPEWDGLIRPYSRTA